MRKLRLISLLTIFLLTISFLETNVYMSEASAVEKAAEAIELDLLTSQSGYAVTKSFDLTSELLQSILDENSVTVSWSSSNSSVLSVSGNRAKITRAETDQNVTLIASVTDGTQVKSKEININVPKMSTYVFESEGFGYPDLTGEYPNMISGGRWSKSAAMELYYECVVANNGGNFFLDAFHERYYPASTPWTTYSLSDMPETKTVAVEFSITPAENEILTDAEINSANGKGLYYDFYFVGEDADGNVLTANNMPCVFRFRLDRELSGTSVSAKASGYSPFLAKSVGSGYTYPTYGDSTRVKFVFTKGTETEAPKFSFYQGETCVVQNQALPEEMVKLSDFKFNIQRQGAKGRFYVDDVVVTAEKSDVRAETLTQANMGSLELEVYADSTPANKLISVKNKYAENMTLKQIVGLRNDTTNPHLDHYGAYLINDITGEEENLTTQSEDDTAPFQINGHYIGANHGAFSTIVTVSGHGKTISDVGSFWLDEEGKSWTLVKIVDANRLMFMSEETSGGTFRHVSAIKKDGSTQTSGTLTSQDEGSEETITFTQQSTGQQLYPSIKNRTQLVYAVLNGEKIPIDISAAQKLKADSLVLNEEYDITDPTQIAANLREGHKAGYSEENPPDYTAGDVVVHYNQTITINNDGTVLTEFNHEIKKAVSSLNYYGYQYYMKTDFGGGVWRYLPGTKEFTYSGKGYDFSVPQNISDKSSTNYPTKSIGSEMWAESTKPQVRMVDYVKNEDLSTKLGFASGFLPIDDGTYENRLNSNSYSFYFWNSSRKAYPYFVSKNKTSVGSTIKGVAYRKYEDTAAQSEAVQTYSVVCGDEVYYYIDFLENAQNVKLKLPDNFDGASDELTEVDVSTHITDVAYDIDGTRNEITLSGSQKGYLVLKAPLKGVKIGESLVNVIGNAQAIVENNGSVRNVTVVFAGYKDGALVAVDMKTQDAAKGSTIVSFDGDFSGCESYKVFALSGAGELKPLCAEKKGTID